MTTEVAVPVAPRLPSIGMGNRGLVFTSMDEMWRFSLAVAKSGLASKGLDTPEAIFVALEMGAELGLPPMAALQNIAVINGRPSLWGDAMLGVARSSGLFDEEVFDERWEGDGDALKAICTVRRLPNGRPIVRQFTLQEAKDAGLLSKDSWRFYRRRMLQMRARGFALRDGFSDVLRGFRSAEEASDYIDVPSRPAANNSARPESLDELADKFDAPSNGHEAQPATEPAPKAKRQRKPIDEKPAAPAAEEAQPSRGLTREKILAQLAEIEADDALAAYYRRTASHVGEESRPWFDSVCSQRSEDIRTLQASSARRQRDEDGQ